MDGFSRWTAIGCAGAVGLLAIVVALALVNRRDEHVGIGEEVHYDDFAFAVESATRAALLGPEGSRAAPHGTFVVVSLRVANHAKRVGFRFDRSIVRLKDADGRRYRVSTEGQAALEASEWRGDPCGAELPAGASCVTPLAFDVAPDARDLRLEFSMGGSPLLDLIDRLAWGDKWIRIE